GLRQCQRDRAGRDDSRRAPGAVVAGQQTLGRDHRPAAAGAAGRRDQTAGPAR
nr:hypothetical protein [Tanacetum cinerariifolium]